MDFPALSLDDPKTQGVLALAMGLLKAGGPSPYPVPFGAALGQGGAAGLETYNTAKRQNLQNAYLQQQAQALDYANKMAAFRWGLVQQEQNRGAGGEQSAQVTQPGFSDSSAQAVGAPWLSAPSQPSAPQPAAPSVPQSPSTGYFNPRQLFAEGRLYNLAGLPGGTAMMETAVNHDPSITGPVALAAKGYVPQPGGGYGLAPGYAEGQGTIAGAEAAAKFPFQATESLLHYAGRPLALGPGQKAISGFSMLPTPFQQIIQNALAGKPGRAATAQPQPINPSGKLPEAEGMDPFAKTSREERGRVLEEQYKGWASQADTAKTDNLVIEQMRRESQSWSPGPAAESWQNIKAYLTRLPGVSDEFKKEVGDYQAFSKNAIQLSATAARAMGAREPGSVIQMFKNAYPNASLTSNALDAMFTQIQGINDYKQALQQSADSWRQDPRNKTPATLDGFQAQWNKVMDPQFFLLRRMSPEVRQQFYASMKPSERTQFAAKYKAALDSGFLPPL